MEEVIDQIAMVMKTNPTQAMDWSKAYLDVEQWNVIYVYESDEDAAGLMSNRKDIEGFAREQFENMERAKAVSVNPDRYIEIPFYPEFAHSSKDSYEVQGDKFSECSNEARNFFEKYTFGVG